MKIYKSSRQGAKTKDIFTRSLTIQVCNIFSECMSGAGFCQLHHESKGEGHSKYQKTMTMRTKHVTLKISEGPFVISVMRTVAKNFEDPP